MNMLLNLRSYVSIILFCDYNLIISVKRKKKLENYDRFVGEN